MSIKIEEIAHIAGVSKSAVSLAMNNRPGISDETRKRILEIVKNHGYIPRSMVKAEKLYGPAKVIRFLAVTKAAVVQKDYASNTFFSELIHGLEKECRNAGFSLIFSTIDQADCGSVEEMEAGHPSQGIILLGTNLTQPEIAAIADVQPLLVVIDNLYEDMDISFIVMNNRAGAARAARYLFGLGHRAIGYVQSAVRVSNFEARKRGFVEALADANISLDPSFIYSVRPGTDEAKADMRAMLRGEKRKLPTAIFCDSDYIAIGVVKALQEEGICVPEEISVIGFDDVPQCTILSPELTTIHVDKEKIGMLAVRHINDMIREKDRSTIKILLDTKLVERKTCMLQR